MKRLGVGLLMVFLFSFFFGCNSSTSNEESSGENHNPQIVYTSPEGVLAVSPGDVIEISVKAVDPDPVDRDLEYVFVCGYGVFDNGDSRLVLHASSGTMVKVRWTAPGSYVGTVRVGFTVKDRRGGSASSTVTFDVGGGGNRAPAYLNASTSYNNGIQLTWESVGGVEGYYIYIGDDRDLISTKKYRCVLAEGKCYLNVNGNWSSQQFVNLTVDESRNSVTVFDDKNLQAAKPYWYRVSSWSVVGGIERESLPSVAAMGQVLPAENVVVNVVASHGESLDEITVNWSPLAGAEKYLVYRSTDINDFFDADKLANLTPIGETYTTQYVDRFQTPDEWRGKAFYYSVRAVVGNVTTAFSYPAMGYLMVIAPPGFSVESGTVGINVVWGAVEPGASASASGVTVSYEIQRACNPQEPQEVEFSTIASGVAQTSYLDGSVAGYKKYWYRVRAVFSQPGSNDLVYSQWTTPQSGYRYAGETPVDPPTDFAATKGSYADKVVLTWTPEEGVVKFTVYRSESDDLSSAEKLADVDGSASTYTDSTVTAGTRYYYWITSWRGDVESDKSGPELGYAGALDVTNFRATDGDFVDKIRLTWDEVEGAVEYRVYKTNDVGGCGAACCGPNNSAWVQIATTTALVYDDSIGMGDINKCFWYKVKTRSASATSTGDTAVDSGYTALPAPTNVQASDGTYPSKIRISWDAVEGATSYLVYRAPDESSTPTLIGEVTDTIFEDVVDGTNVVSNTWYFYRVKAKNAALNAFSNFSLADSGYAGTLPPPTNVSATDGKYFDKVVITWTTIDGVHHYNVYRSESENGTYVKIGSSYTGSYEDNSATPRGKTYWYKIKSALAGDVEESGFSSADSGYTKFSPPTGVQASDGMAADKVVVSWTAPTDCTPSKYEIYRGTSDDVGAMQKIGESTTTSYVDTSVNVNTVYYYRIRTVVGENVSDFSDSDSGYAGSAPPENLEASDGTYEDKIHLTWTAVPGATHYKIYRSLTNTGPESFVQIATVSAPSTSYDDTPDDPVYPIVRGITYYYQVTAVVNGVEGERSNVDSGWAVPLPPTNVVATDGSFRNKITVTWDPPEGPEYPSEVSAAGGTLSYKVFRAIFGGSGPGGFGQVATVNQPTYEDTNVPQPPDYVFWYKVSTVVRSGGEDHESVMSQQDMGYVDFSPSWVNAQDGSGSNYQRIVVSWELVQTHDIHHYDIERATSRNGQYQDEGHAYRPDLPMTEPDVRNPHSPPSEVAIGVADDDNVYNAWPETYHVDMNNPMVDPTPPACGIVYWYRVRAVIVYVYNDKLGDDYSADEWNQSPPPNNDPVVPGLTIYSPWSEPDSGYWGPTKPVNLTASDGLFADRVRVEWDPPEVGSVQTYNVYRSQDGVNYSLVASVTASGGHETWDDTSVGYGRYYYRVTALYNSIESDPSDPDSGYKSIPTPTGLVATNGPASSEPATSEYYSDHVHLSWNPVTGAESYEVFRTPRLGGCPADVSQYTLIGTSSNSEFDDYVNVQPYTDYCYVVRTVVGNAPSQPSSPNVGDAEAVPPKAVEATDGDYADRIRITWTPVPRAEQYNIYRSNDGTLGTLIATVDAGNSFYDDLTPPDYNTYYYTVRTVISGNESDPSLDEADYEPPPTGNKDKGYRGTGNAPLPPTNVQASDGTSNTEVTITWTVPTDVDPNTAGNQVADYFKVYRSQDGINFTCVGQTADGTVSAFHDTSAPLGKLYYKVTSVLGGVEGAFSNTDDGYRNPPPVTGVDASRGPDVGTVVAGATINTPFFPDKIRVAWDALTGSDYYEVAEDTSAAHDCSTTTSVGTTTNTYYDVSIDAADMYSAKYYCVRAWFGGTSGPWQAGGAVLGDAEYVHPAWVQASDGPLSGDPSHDYTVNGNVYSSDTIYVTYAEVPNASQYSIDQDGDGTFDDTDTDVDYSFSVGANTYDDYTVKVRAGGGGHWSRSDGYCDPGAAPGVCGLPEDIGDAESVPPNNVQASDGTSGQIDITWDAVPNATSYKIYRTVDAGGSPDETQWQEVHKVTGDPLPTNWTDNTVSSGTVYWYRVRTVINGHESDPMLDEPSSYGFTNLDSGYAS